MARYIDADKWPDLGMYDTTDLAEMLAQFDTVDAVPHWVRVEDELPPEDRLFVVYGKRAKAEIMTCNPKTAQVKGEGLAKALKNIGITHWLKGLELPEVNT